MRVLVAVDGSPASVVARCLVASLPWAPDDVLRIVTVLDEGHALFGPRWAAVAVSDPGQLEGRLEEASQAVIDQAVAGVEPSVSARVEAAVLRGRPSSTIVQEAAAFQADLIVIGTRGNGPFQSALLGSVSAEVVDQAPCPVLIARRATLARIMLADDGSAAAAVARRLIGARPFDGLPVRVVSVATVPPPWQGAVSPMATELALEAWDETLRIHREDHEQIAAASAEELAADARPVDTKVRVGDPAGEVVAAATDWHADLIAIGTHGRTGLERLLIGSVARNVLHHASASVLVARENGRRGPAPAELNLRVEQENERC